MPSDLVTDPATAAIITGRLNRGEVTAEHLHAILAAPPPYETTAGWRERMCQFKSSRPPADGATT